MAKDKAPAAGEELDVRVAWRRDDPVLEADAIAFWERLGVLPADVAPAQRAKELAAGVYKDGALVAVVTAVPQRIDFLRANFLQLRSIADPACSREEVQAAFANPVRRTLEEWAAANPEQALAGVVTFVDPKVVGELAHMPVWPVWPLSLVGYLNDGRQVRVCWFDHFLFD